jgi:hypothetical protein
MSRILEVLQKWSLEAPQGRSVLCHAGFTPKHWLYHGRRLTGVTNFGEVQGHLPVLDFARLNYAYPAIPLVWLQEGYGNAQLFDESFEAGLHTLRLSIGLSALWRYLPSINRQSMQLMKQALLDDLAYFS